MIHLQAITWNNFWEVTKINPKPEQVKFVKPVSLFMAQSYINLKANHPDESLAIYNDKTLIGFTKIVLVPKDVEPYKLNQDSYMIDALIIDQSQQGKGYGRKSLAAIIDYCQTYPFGQAEVLTLVCFEENQQAQVIFTTFGFKKVKQINKEKKMCLYKVHL